jgi:hypothetical protein
VVHTELSSFYVLNKIGLKDEVFLGSEPLALGNINAAVKKVTQLKLLDRVNQKSSEPDHKKSIDLFIKSYKNS